MLHERSDSRSDWNWQHKLTHWYSNATYNNCVVFVYKYLLLYCVYLYHLCEAHLHVWIRKPAVPCVSISPVAAWLSFTVIVSAVQTQQVWRRPLWPRTAQSSYCRVCVCVCVQLYPCISTFYLNTLQHRLVTLRVAAPRHSPCWLYKIIREDIGNATD